MTWRKHTPIGRIFTQLNTKTTSQDLVDQKITGYTQFLSNLKFQFKKGSESPYSHSRENWRGNQTSDQRRPYNQIEQLYQRNFVAPVVNKAKKDGSVKIAMDAKPIKAQIFKNQYQMPNLLEQLDVAAQTINSNLPGEVLFTSLDLKYALS